MPEMPEKDLSRDWTSITANIIAIIVILTFAVVIISTSVFLKEKEIMTAAGGIMAGIVGVILTFYFDQSRIKSAQEIAETTSAKAQSETIRAGRESVWRTDYAEQLRAAREAVVALEQDNQELIGLMDSLNEEKRGIIRAYNDVYQAYEALADNGDNDGQDGS